MKLATLTLLFLVCACSACPTQPRDDTAYYERVCAAAGMTHIKGTRTCIGRDSSFINLQPPRGR